MCLKFDLFTYLCKMLHDSKGPRVKIKRKVSKSGLKGRKRSVGISYRYGEGEGVVRSSVCMKMEEGGGVVII